ncbi:hypothetical protein [Streptomyces montanus]|uniref:hypothetical protein n=1 Tax=Streptomyces montanus TaxID=2580423 RepID=UPI001486A9E6
MTAQDAVGGGGGDAGAGGQPHRSDAVLVAQADDLLSDWRPPRSVRRGPWKLRSGTIAIECDVQVEDLKVLAVGGLQPDQLMSRTADGLEGAGEGQMTLIMSWT